MPPKVIYTKIRVTEFVNFTLAFPHIILTFGFLYKNAFNLSENKKGCLKLKKKKSLTQLAVKIHVRKITSLQKTQGLLNGTKLLIWKIISYACAAITTNYISNIHIYTHTIYWWYKWYHCYYTTELVCYFTIIHRVWQLLLI